MRGLYSIVDLDSLRARDLEVVPFVERLVAARPPLLQLRAKHASARDTLSLLRQIGSLCRQHGVLCFANDRPDLALLAGVDGVHVGQNDLPVSDVRRFAPGLKVGVSTHDAAELEAALALAPDYVAFGPVFATRSKQQPDPVVGLGRLARAAERARAAGVPLCAIGGIGLDTAASVAEHAELGAVIAALLPEAGEGLESVTERALALQRLLGGAA